MSDDDEVWVMDIESAISALRAMTAKVTIGSYDREERGFALALLAELDRLCEIECRAAAIESAPSSWTEPPQRSAHFILTGKA